MGTPEPTPRTARPRTATWIVKHCSALLQGTGYVVAAEADPNEQTPEEFWQEIGKEAQRRGDWPAAPNEAAADTGLREALTEIAADDRENFDPYTKYWEWDNRGDIHEHGLEAGIHRAALTARAALAAASPAPAELDTHDHGEVLRQQVEHGLLKRTERDLAYVDAVTEPNEAAEQTCDHIHDFEFSLALPFDPQGRDDRPEDDSTVTCWKCGQTWTKPTAPEPEVKHVHVIPTNHLEQSPDAPYANVCGCGFRYFTEES